MNNNINELRDDEIDIVELIISIWKGRWFILLFIILSLVLSAVFIAITSDRFKAELYISPVATSEFDAYRELNSVDFITVSRESLLSRFIDQIENSDIAYTAFRQSIEPGSLPQDEIEQAVVEQVKNLKIDNLSDNKNHHGSLAYRLTYEGSDPEQFRSVIRQILSTANYRVWSDLNQLAQQELNILQVDRAYRLESLENRIESHRILYQKNLEARLAFLKEQSVIAHSLGIKQSALPGELVSLGGASLATLGKSTPEYYRGYLAIDKEIELLGSRKDDDTYITGIDELIIEKNELENSNRFQRIKEALENSPLAGPEGFHAVIYDLNRMEIESKVKAPLVLALALILGFMLGVLALGLKNILASRTQA